MARRYARDNRGRFASSGSGATARGGRLRTAAGNKRKTQTMQASAAPKGTIGKPRGLKPQSAKPAPSAATIAQVGRERRATRNLNAAMKREAEGPGSKASRSASVAKRARAIYAGKVDPKQKTAARLTRTNNPEALRKRIKKIKDNNAAKPARAAATPRTGQEIMKADVRKVQNKKIRDLNRQIKEAGPNAAGLRLQKLQVQSRLDATRPRQTAKQAAKSAKQTEVVRGRIAEMRRQNARIGRATANKERTADTRNKPGSRMFFRPSAKTTRANNLADRALNFYANPAKALREVRKNRPGFRMPRTMR